jgi:hypothetical protein
MLLAMMRFQGFFFSFLIFSLEVLEVLAKDGPPSIEQVSTKISSFLHGCQNGSLSADVTSTQLLFSGCALAVSRDWRKLLIICIDLE